MDRLNTAAGEFARLGFVNVSAAIKLFDEVVDVLPQVSFDPGEIALGAVPDLALAGVAALAQTAPEKLREVWQDDGARSRLIAVLGGSEALNLHLRAHPDQLDAFFVEPVRSKKIAERLAKAVATDDGSHAPIDRLRLANKWELLRIAARDLIEKEPLEILEDVAAELADLADAVVEGALEVAKEFVPDWEKVRLGVVAMGKCGGQELNYLSDVDVIFVAEPAGDASVSEAMQIASKWAGAASRVCSEFTSTGSIWQLDAALRPEGKSGPLVRTLESCQAYYEKWAENWEFQAMLKARPQAGDMDLAQKFCDIVYEKVWQAGGQENFITQMQAMRKRVVDNIPERHRLREIKLGSGGLRDVEFTVQLLQLVHGRADERLRQRGTLPALRALVEHGYIGRVDGAMLERAYIFARVLEHREQLFRLRRTHLMPIDEESLGRLARQVGSESGKALFEDWKSSTRTVLRLQQRVFYSPLLDAVSKLSTDSLRLSAKAAQDRLWALGFSDAKAALGHIEALTEGFTRAAEIQRQLLPAMLQWFSEGPNPDLGILLFRRLSEDMGKTSWYLRALRDEGSMAERLAKILSASRYASDLLRRDASMVQFLSDDSLLVPRAREDLVSSMLMAANRHRKPEDSAAAVRALRRRELFRLAVGDVLGIIDLEALGRGLSDLADATIEAALDIARRVEDVDVPIGIVAMGRWGGGELSYASDVDAMVVVGNDADSEQISAAGRVIATARKILNAPGPDPALEIDLGLRPEGRKGAMVRTVGSYQAYYDKWSDTWEAQALVRARYGAGDEALVDELLQFINPLRWPEGGLSDKQVTAIRRLKARMETERAGRNAQRNLKLGPGGLSDVEWTVQLVQMQKAADVEELRVTGTLPALQAATDAGLINPDDAHHLAEAWTLASELRNSAMLVRGRASDLLPGDYRDIAAMGMLLGYGRGESSTLIGKWERTARLADKVVEREFWGRK